MSRNKIQNEKIKDERRAQILNEALKIFAVKGLGAARVSDISKSTGISQGLIYHYFGSKEEMFTELVTTAIRNLNHAARELEKSPLSSKDKLILAVKELLAGIENSGTASTYYFLITQAAMSESVPEEARNIIRQENHVKYEVMQRIFEQGQQEGSIRTFDVSKMAVAFWSLINGLAINRAINQERYNAPDKEIFLSMFLKD